MIFTADQISITVLAVAVLILGIAVFYQDWRIKRMMRGKSGADIEELLRLIEKEYRAMKNFRDAMSEYLKTVEDRLGKSIQAVETIRFNAWKGAGNGGNQSFASAFISEKGNGIILSSLHSRDRVSIFTKSIKNFQSELELTAEEKEALEKTRAKIGTKL